jgi:hypothetical protein
MYHKRIIYSYMDHLYVYTPNPNVSAGVVSEAPKSRGYSRGGKPNRTGFPAKRIRRANRYAEMASHTIG